jgi:hypothetical protein
MRRNPLGLLLTVFALLVYLEIRELGHLVSGLILALPTRLIIRYRIMPAVEIDLAGVQATDGMVAFVIASGPALVLIVGYLLLVLMKSRGRSLRPPLGMAVGLLCYASLILDPIYYSIVPLARLGGEPETLARSLGIPILGIVLGAFGLLALNVLLLRWHLLPIMKGPR